MTAMRRFKQLIVLRALSLVAVLVGLAYLLFRGDFLYAVLLSPFAIYLLVLVFRSQVRAYRELEEFAEAAKYRDFTRFYPLSHANAELRPLRNAFNEINGVFKKISHERETHYQYLNHILSVVDTAILSYDRQTRQVIWMNEAFKKLFEIPYLHQLDALAKRNAALFAKTAALVPGKQELATLPSAKGNIKLLLVSHQFETAEGQYELVLYQNVNEAIDEAESRAWQKLLSVLTHEIMNSIAPISSLADTLGTRLAHLDSNDDIDDIRLGADTIKRRSEGLLKFAGTYRSLNKVDRPNRSTVYASQLFENLYVLMAPTLEQKGIELDIILRDTQLQLHLDVALVEQVLINLLLNALEAVKDVDSPRIALVGDTVDGRGRIQVSDNGMGMAPDLVERIFIPFFTLRKSGAGHTTAICFSRAKRVEKTGLRRNFRLEQVTKAIR